MIATDRLEEFTKDCRHWPGCDLENPPHRLGCSVCLEGGYRDKIHPMTLRKAAKLMAEALEAVLNASITKRDQAEDDAVEALATYKAVRDA